MLGIEPVIFWNFKNFLDFNIRDFWGFKEFCFNFPIIILVRDDIIISIFYPCNFKFFQLKITLTILSFCLLFFLVIPNANFQRKNWF